MSIYADNTCGFLPLHLYEGHELDRASDICHAINLFALEGMGLGSGRADPRPLQDLSLQSMLDAVRTVRTWNGRPKMLGVGYSCSMVPDDRLTAAVYTLIHFHNPSASDSDADEVPVQFTTSHRHDDIVHFLLVGARPKPADEIEGDEERDAA